MKTLFEAGADSFVKGGEYYVIAFPEVSLGLYNRQRRVAPKPAAIHHAAANGHENVIGVLPYLDETYGDGEITALHLGTSYGHPDVIQALLSKGAEIETIDFHGITALHYASYNGHSAVVQLLLNKGCKVET